MRIIFLLITACLIQSVHAEPASTAEEPKLNARSAFVVKPETPAEGRPWVWRARFPGYHDDIDVLLLKQGFHIAHINTGGTFASKKALDDWDAFYDHVTTAYKLAPHVGLEGVSRGGLFMYGWAKRHPDRVTCIYGDTPVCDIKSWPLGDGAGKGSEETWASLLKHYEMTDEAARAYTDNPIDNLEPLAKVGIPILHIVSEDDEIVPPKENTYILQERYKKLGGDMEVISVAHGTVPTNGHHFKLEHPEVGAAFFVEHAGR
jgi:pimeloyl-ACP methyl ester carboxylesterase